MKSYFLLFLVLTQFVSVAFGNVQLSFPFGNHMVLQREMNTPVRGTADPGEEVTVSFNGQTHSALADGDGNWELFLDPMHAGGPYILEATSVNNSVTFSNVMVGDVWFCSGQSNMASKLKNHYTTDTLLTGIELLRVANGKGQSIWKESTKTAVENITAVGFYFARNLVLELGVPIGIIEVAWGGSSLEQWMDSLTVSEIPHLTWGGDFGGKIVGERWPLMTQEIQFGIKGILWYQGEANANQNTLAPYYKEHLEYLIKGWRRQWGQGNIPFYVVQLPNLQAKQTTAVNLNLNAGWPVIREAQRLALNLPNTGVATTIDIGEADDIHPLNKWDVGLRLALIARANLYGEKDLVYSGPVFKSKSIEGNQIRLKFVSVGSGLMSVTGENLEGFRVLDANGNYEWGNAVIDGDEVVVTAPTLSNPTDVFYAWHINPIISLYNAEGLPAGPFKTTGDQVSLTRFGCRKGAMDTTITVHDASVCETGFVIPVEGLSFDGCPTGELYDGTSLQLFAAVFPSDATDRKVIWSSSDTTILVVNENGLITTLAEGIATITASTTTNDFSDGCVVTVVNEVIAVNGVAIGNCQRTIFQAGDTYQLITIIVPYNATDMSVTWSSSKPDVATVDESGLISAISEGTTRITLTTNDGGYTDFCSFGVQGVITGVFDHEEGNNSSASVEIYPNPVSEVLNFKFLEAVFEKKISFYNTLGQMLFSATTFESNLKFNINEFSSEEMVFVQVISGKVVDLFKVVIM